MLPSSVILRPTSVASSNAMLKICILLAAVTVTVMSSVIVSWLPFVVGFGPSCTRARQPVLVASARLIEKVTEIGTSPVRRNTLSATLKASRPKGVRLTTSVASLVLGLPAAKMAANASCTTVAIALLSLVRSVSSLLLAVNIEIDIDLGWTVIRVIRPTGATSEDVLVLILVTA